MTCCFFIPLQRLSSEKPWLAEPKWFTKVKVSAAAAAKMTTHAGIVRRVRQVPSSATRCLSYFAATGVDKGLKSSNAMPVEVMGLMVGHIDTEDPHSLIVSDVFPLPVEGTETTVSEWSGLAYGRLGAG